MTAITDAVRLDLPTYDEEYLGTDIEENSFAENPLAHEFAIKTRKYALPAEEFRQIEICYFSPKVPRITKAEKRRERGSEGKKKSSYSVFEDMVMLTHFKAETNKGLSMNEVVDLVMEDLPNRSFESLRERYRKWLKDFSSEDVDKIMNYCEVSYDKCERYMIKRRRDEKNKRFVIEDFVEIPKVAAGPHRELDPDAEVAPAHPGKRPGHVSRPPQRPHPNPRLPRAAENARKNST